MGKIVVSENISLDGVIQDPTGDEGFGRGGWFSQLADTDRDAWAKSKFEEALQAQALLLGRRSDEWFATRWMTRTGEWADRLNELPKHVVSSTLLEAHWRNGTILTGDLTAEVAKLKHQYDGDIVVYASGQLVHALLERDLVDELRLTIFPVVLGAGERLFGATDDLSSMRLLDSSAVGADLVELSYAAVR